MVHNAVGEASVRDFSVDEATLDVIFANGEYNYLGNRLILLVPINNYNANRSALYQLSGC